MERQQKVADLFAAVLEKEPAAQYSFLKAECGEDVSLFAEVGELLIAFGEAESNDFMSFSALEIEAENFAVEKSDLRTGQIFGHYKISKQVGSGGMGAVYLATRTDGEFNRRVAIKLIKGGFISEENIRRFRNERQILAGLEHPNIARLIDGNTTADGLPYLVMEYVDGIPIDEFCAEKHLSIEEKLKLFRKVCSAVSYAHRNLIIHRDLKPSNILVTEDGEPKLLDFGIAKLFSSDQKQSETMTNFRALTIEYASPEQLCGEKLTTATDIYSLGVILYELLTGTQPFEINGKNFAEVLRIVSQTAPNRPSSAARYNSPLRKSRAVESNKQQAASAGRVTDLLKGDIDNIVLKSLGKAPERRYPSVEQFADDIGRYLKGLPVLARKDSFTYRSEKFIKRNKIAMTAAALILLLLTGGVAAIWRQAKIAETAGARAERRAENLRVLSSSFIIELHDAIINLPGSLPARQLLLRRAVEQLDALAAESEGNPQLQNELARGYYNLGLLPNVNLAEVEQNFQKGVSIYQMLLKSEPQSIEFRKQLAKGYTELANVEKVRGSFSKSLGYLQKSTSLLEAIVGEEPAVVEHRQVLWEIMSDTSGLLLKMGRAKESLEVGRRQEQLGAGLKQLDPGGHDEFEEMGIALHYNICKSLIYLGDYANALKLLSADSEIVSAQAGVHPNDTRYRYQLWSYDHTLSIALERSGEKKAALDKLQFALDLMNGLYQSSPDDAGYQRNDSFTYLAVGQFFTRQNQPAKALPYFLHSREISEKIFTADPEKGETIVDLAGIYSGLGNASILLGNREEGLLYLHQSLEFYGKSLERGTDNILLKRDYAETLARLGAASAKSADAENRRQGQEFYAKSLEIWRELQAENLLSAADATQPDEVEQMLIQAKFFAAK